MTDRIAAPRLPASIEIPPFRVRTLPDLHALMPAGTRVYLPDLGIADDWEMIAAASAIRNAGAEPVPHLAARRIASRAVLEARLARLAGEAGVRDVLVIAGEQDPPAGPFSSSMDLLETGLLDRHGITRIGVAGHPEGSPVFAADIALEALRLKQAFANRTGAQMRIVTQFGFDMPAFCAWTEALSAPGIDLRVHLGMAGPTKFRALLGYARACGVGPSLQVLSRRGTALLSLLRGYSPEVLARAAEAHVAASPYPSVAGLHIFPFGGAVLSADWLRRRGSWPSV